VEIVSGDEDPSDYFWINRLLQFSFKVVLLSLFFVTMYRSMNFWIARTRVATRNTIAVLTNRRNPESLAEKLKLTKMIRKII
jgi:hypothetical protein